MRLRDRPLSGDFLIYRGPGKVCGCIAGVNAVGLSCHISDRPCTYAIRIHSWLEQTSTVRSAIEHEAKDERPVVEIASIQHEIPRARKDILTNGSGFTNGNWRLSRYCCRKLHAVDAG